MRQGKKCPSPAESYLQVTCLTMLLLMSDGKIGEVVTEIETACNLVKDLHLSIVINCHKLIK